MVQYLVEPLEEYLAHSEQLRDEDEEEREDEGYENDEDVEPRMVFTDTQKLIAGIVIALPLLLGMFWLLNPFRRD
jgi:hypothetical protein